MLPRYGLAMICKNEATTIRACLESLRPYIGWWTIADTGSTDGTQDVIREVLGGIPGELLERPFVDFGTNRSEVFAAIRGKCEWYFATDADMVWTIAPDFAPDDSLDAYTIALGDATMTWRLPLLHRCGLPWVSVGRVHEVTTLADGREARREPTDAIRIAMPTAPERRSDAKSRQYLAMLEADLADRPDDPRTFFMLGGAHLSLGDRERAREMYGQRSGMGGAPEEVYYAAYQAAVLAPEWPTRAAELMAAWEVRPSRYEALNGLCRELNHRGLHQAAYLLSGGEYPQSDDAVFVHPWVAEWGMKLERSIAAFWTGHHDECRDLSLELLARDDLPADVRTAVGWNLVACTEEAA